MKAKATDRDIAYTWLLLYSLWVNIPPLAASPFNRKHADTPLFVAGRFMKEKFFTVYTTFTFHLISV
ncbi:hypothetical protein LQZ18_12325 [Lachnospiraceae bacterium ZAX-1]